MSESFTSYVVDNDKKFRIAMKRAANVSTDLRVPFGLILKDFYKSEQAIFKLSGPGKYPPFKGERGADGLTKYQRAKIEDVGHDYPLLVRTGALMNSLLGPNNRGSISKITNLSLTFGTSIKYGIYHQSDEPRSKIPLRKFLFIGPEAPRFATSDQMGRLQRWRGYMIDHVERQLKKEIGG
jgi:hypothetical protein